MAPSCTLDETGLRRQYERYRDAGRLARVRQRSRRRLVVDLDQSVELALVDELVAVERGCCPFFAIDWRPESRRLTVSVAEAAHEPALDALAFALELPADSG